MAKYWNKGRMRRVRERETRKELRAKEEARDAARAYRTRTPGNRRKNARLIFDALGLPLRRYLLERLAREGTMSLSKLVKPFNLTLPTAQFHLDILESAGLVDTHKQGRSRLCTYSPAALVELASHLKNGRPDFD
jgi:DNA-binding transcriptional ArsR family regulator